MSSVLTPQEAAPILVAAGMSVIPVKSDGSKGPAVQWKTYQQRRPTEEELSKFFVNGYGIAIVAGHVSGDLEIIDVEVDAPFTDLCELINEHASGLLEKLPRVATPTGGYHLFYRCDELARNQKLALTGEGKVLIETRGEGGYVVTITSPPACHPLGKTYTLVHGLLSRIPRITAEEREILLSCCRSFNKLIRVEDRPAVKVTTATGKRPGDDYNARGDGLGVLLKAGWKVEGRRNRYAYLRRPGKARGISASWGFVGPNTLYVFSTNAAPFDFERAYDQFGIYCRIEAHGDPVLAARQLAALGYGEPAPKPEPLREVLPAAAADSLIPEPEKPVTDDNLGLVYMTMKVTEDNVALAFEERYKDELRYCNTWGKWLSWTEGLRWKPDNTLRAFDYCRLIARRLNIAQGLTASKASFARGVESFCRASRTFATESSDWDKNVFHLNTPGGTYDLRTGEMYSHRIDDHITKITQVPAQEGPHPVFDMFLRDITLNDQGLQEYLQRALGACLSGAIQDNFLLFWYGTGQNGKNTFGDLITWILGDYAKVIPVDTLIAQKGSDKHPTVMANLRGLRLAVCSEVSEGSYWDESRVKSLTGDTEIAGRFMKQDYFEFPRTHKHLVYGNHRPMLRIVDQGMKARLHIVPFKAYFPPDARDPEMRKKLEAEAPAILHWLLEGHARWLEDGYLKKCSAVQDETDSYFEAQATNEAWLLDCCNQDTSNSCPAKELYQSFKNWKEARGEGVISQNRWGEWMGQRFDRRRLTTGYVYDRIELKPQSILFPN